MAERRDDGAYMLATVALLAVASVASFSLGILVTRTRIRENAEIRSSQAATELALCRKALDVDDHILRTIWPDWKLHPGGQE
jgi:hypothetical protein